MIDPKGQRGVECQPDQNFIAIDVLDKIYLKY